MIKTHTQREKNLHSDADESTHQFIENVLLTERTICMSVSVHICGCNWWIFESKGEFNWLLKSFVCHGNIRFNRISFSATTKNIISHTIRQKIPHFSSIQYNNWIRNPNEYIDSTENGLIIISILYSKLMYMKETDKLGVWKMSLDKIANKRTNNYNI